ncbi:gliding motility-associated C-terminal domain-containing protein [Hymenobacter nivis]|nr:gliding motility-associated C-terminal domain-containing protein [Hymenobacter nivis]
MPFRLLLAALALGALLARPAGAQNPDLPPATARPTTAPAGTLVLALDNAGQRLNGQFNLKAYGLAVHLLNNKVPLRWVIRSGKGKDEPDFTALAARAVPRAGAPAAAARAFRAGPLLVLPRDTAGVRALAAAFNAAQGTAVNLYELREAATVDVRYVLNQRPVAAILNDGGNAAIHQRYMRLAGISGNDNVAPLRAQDNYATQVAVDLDGQTDCFTFASEPHSNNTAGGVVEAIRRFAARGGNFLAECEAVVTYENYAGGRFLTSGGVADADVRDANARRYPAPDQPLVQFEGEFRASVLGGSVTNWRRAAGSAFANGGYAASLLSSSTDEVLEASAADLYAGRGGLVFYLGGHQYAGTTEDDLNGQRMYLNAFLVPATTFQSCNVFADENGNALATALRYTICPGDSARIVLPAATGAPETYAWGPATGLSRLTGTTMAASPAATTAYTVQATSATGTRYIGVTVVVLAGGTLRIGTSGCPPLAGQEVVFQADAGADAPGALTWDFGDGTPAASGPAHRYAQPGRYTVRASGQAASGCPVQATTAVEVGAFQVPNVFTPNADGRNDTFELPGLPAGSSLQVFSRWGQRVFAADGYANDWDGAGQPAGAYYYLLRVGGCGTPVKGWVEIVR